MRNRHVIRALAALAGGCATIVLSTPAGAQFGVAASSVRVAVPDSFPAPGARALVVRFADGQDIILLNPEHASAEALAAALTLLGELRRATPRAPATQVVTIQGYVRHRAASVGALGRHRMIMELLHRQPIARIGNLGQGRWIALSTAGIMRS
ncbi:MAG TPA: hypothetical protein VJ596_04280 [Gemmatimonadaceae bacterium]|nr:hypothetical protein [Gemmatimonadaceae bacterium]